jgi:RNase P/RNase MRP subunit POP5
MDAKKKSDLKIKGVKPTMRQKKRFVATKIVLEKPMMFKDLASGLLYKLTFLLGSLDMSEHGVWILKDQCDEKNQVFVIKVSTKLKDKLLAALVLVDEINRFSAKCEILGVSGTLKGLKTRLKK